MAGGPHAARVACLTCAFEGVVAPAERTSEGMENDGYRCARGHTPMIDWSRARPTAPTWPPSAEECEAIAKMGRAALGVVEAPSEAPRRTVQLPTGPAAYAEDGPADAPAVICVHGLPGSVRDFRWLAPQLGDARLRHPLRVIRPELPGFGDTPIETWPDPSPDGRAAFVLALVAALGLERPLLLGHSMGGVVACAAVRRAPEVWLGLGLLASPGLRKHGPWRRLAPQPLHAALTLPLVSSALMPVVRRGFVASGFVGFPDAALRRTIACVAATDVRAHAANVRTLSLPTLVAFCADDPLIETAILDELAAVCPDGPRLRYQRGGHNLQKAHAVGLGDAIRDWAHGLRVGVASGRSDKVGGAG